MQELRRRIGKTFERQKKIFEVAILSLSDNERNGFLDTIYDLPGVTEYVDQKVIEEYDTGGESLCDFIDRHFVEYKAEYEKKNKPKVCR